MRIMLVTYRYGRDIAGGGERYLRELMIRLAGRGHQVEVYTTRSRQMILSPFNYLVWDNFLPPGGEEDQGVVINRFKVNNPRPRRARRMMRGLNTLQEKERDSLDFASLMAETMSGIRENCFLSGWHRLERWEDGPARWTQKLAKLVVGGKDISGLILEAYSYLDGDLLVEVLDKGSWEFELEKGKPRELGLDFAPCDSAAVALLVPRAVRPQEDAREVGVAVRRVAVVEGGVERELDLGRGWTEFLDSGPEEVVGKVLWGTAERRPRRISRRHEYLMGPRSTRLEKEVMAAAHRFDLVFVSMVPMSTMGLAWKAANRAGKPLVAFPLFHTRDPNHYWAHFKETLENAAGVEANTEVIADLMAEWGFKTFVVGPGYDLEEFSSPHIDGGRFRREFGFGDQPILLWVARKNVYKGYREAIAALRIIRESGCPAVLAIVGPDEDYLPVSGEGVYYLGSLPRGMLLDAYDACDVFIFPSLHESFCMVFGEAWLRGKPVLGNAYCAAARGLIGHGKDGYLCTDAGDYARRALELIDNPGKAREMGERGRLKVVETRGWEHLVEELEKKLAEIVDRS
jgi:glycosyltransferase involved in cell wall biosynthesis